MSRGPGSMQRGKALGAAGIAAAIAGVLSAQPPVDVRARVAAIGQRVDPRSTAAIYAPLQSRVPQPGVTVRRDVAYGPGPKDRFDLFLPEAASPVRRPILIFVHGGAFRFDDKAQAPDGSPSPFYDNVMLWGVAHGAIGINMNYGLAPGAAYPEVQRDIATMVAWAREHAASLDGDPDRIVLWGHSAGASHVASFLAHPEIYRDIAGAAKPVHAAILYSGIYDMSGDARDHVYFGKVEQLLKRSMVAGLVASSVPLLVETAELDPPDMARQASALDAALTQAGRRHTFLVASGHGHMSEIYAVNTGDRSIADPVLAFLQ